MTEDEILAEARKIKRARKKAAEEAQKSAREAGKRARELAQRTYRFEFKNYGAKTFEGQWAVAPAIESWFEPDIIYAKAYQEMLSSLNDGDRLRVTYELLGEKDET
jgi:hypothetical protein